LCMTYHSRTGFPCRIQGWLQTALSFRTLRKSFNCFWEKCGEGIANFGGI